jgi:SAM-dependent methyltransferase
MNTKLNFIEQLGKIDLYLLDQLMKGRIDPGMCILDAGFGHGRNSQYFIERDFDIWGVDSNKELRDVIDAQIKIWNPNYDKSKFQIANLEKIPFPDRHFDLIISCAVLHFAENRTHFIQLFEESMRVLKSGGIFWFRMTTIHTIESHVQHLQDDVYLLPDGSTRYLLELDLLHSLIKKHDLIFLDPFKTVNVANLRTMCVAALQKIENFYPPSLVDHGT